jgi:UDP-GlcNAc:undecaprenyl-phosphate GlcNAc-1-phosphate transferase
MTADATLQFVPVLVFGFAASLGLTPLSRQIAFRLGVIDRPKKRNVTKAPTPMMGGFAIYVSLALSLILFSPPQHLVELGAVIAGGAFLALIGLVDDRYELSIRHKGVAIALAIGVLIAAGIQVRLFDNPLLDWPITFLWVFAITNAVNFLDNMDGVCAGIAAIAGGFFLIAALLEGLTLVALLAAAIFGSAVGFLAYNFSPAASFMGDMGALPLGFMLAVLGIKLEFTQPLSVTWMVPILVLALPVFDINLVVFTRLSEGRSPGEGGKDHTTHRLIDLGLSPRWMLFAIYAACALFGAIGVLVSQVEPALAWLIGLGGFALMGAGFLFMTWVRRTRQRYQLDAIRRITLEPASREE